MDITSANEVACAFPKYEKNDKRRWNWFFIICNLQLLQDQFEKRFQQYNNIEPMVTFFINLFTYQVNVMEIATKHCGVCSSKDRRTGAGNFGSSERHCLKIQYIRWELLKNV